MQSPYSNSFNRTRLIQTFGFALLFIGTMRLMAQPALVSARRTFADHTQITVVFSTPVSNTTATAVSNYVIDQGVTVATAGIRADEITVVLTTSALADGQTYTLSVSGVRDLAGNPIAANSQIQIDLKPLLPLEFGTPINGFQDDFEGESRNPDWVEAPPGLDVYTQTNRVLVVGAGPNEGPHLLYQAAGYDDTIQEVLARIRVSVDGRGDPFKAGLGVGVSPGSSQGLDILFRYGSFPWNPSNFPDRFFQFVRFGLAWGTTIRDADLNITEWSRHRWYWLRIRQEPDYGIDAADGFAKVWLADGDTPEPEDWQARWDFAQIPEDVRQGFAGIVAGWNSLPAESKVDYVLIKAEGLPSITPACEAFSPPTQAGTLTITQQPQNVTAAAGQTATFAVAVTSSWPLAFYRWEQNVGGIWQPVGQDLDTLITAPLTVADNGRKYRVAVAIPGANVVSSEATLTVQSASINITQQPLSMTVMESLTATLTVSATNSAGATQSYQWQRLEPGGTDYADIDGATKSSYTTPPLTIATDSLAKYRVVVSIPGGISATSAAVTLTVIPNVTPPALFSARRLIRDHTQVTVVFSKAVSDATAAVVSNYAIDGGTAVTAAAMGADLKTVVLTTSDIPDGATRTLTVNGVQDLFGNTIVANSTIAISQLPLAPHDVGTLVPGFQDDFDGTALDTNWVAAPPGVNDDGSVFMLGDGFLDVGRGPAEGPHLLYQAPGYSDSVQEVLARIRVTGVVVEESGDPFKGGVGLGISPNSSQGLNVLIRNTLFQSIGIARHLQLIRFGIAWGPVLYTDDTHTTGFTWDNDSWYWVRVRQELDAQGPDVFAKAWLADGDTPEPDTWGATWDVARSLDDIRKGFAGVVASQSSADPEEKSHVDYILIKADGLPQILASPNATDQTPPNVVLARRLYHDHTQVTVLFSEPVTEASATTLANYSVSGGVSVTGATLRADGRTVVLATSAVADGVAHTLTINDVQDRAGNRTLNLTAIVNLRPLAPAEVGTLVNGYQDTFDGTTLNANWVAAPSGVNADGSVFRLNNGLLEVGKGAAEGPHLLYQAPGYDPANQEVLARLRVRGVTAPDSGDPFKGGIGLGIDPNSSQGLDLLFRNTLFQSIGIAPHVQLIRFGIAWGPVVYTDSSHTEGLTWQNDTWYWVRVRQQFNPSGPDVYAKVWLADGDTPEPDTWGATWDFANSANDLRQGFAGIVASHSAAQAGEKTELNYFLLKATGLPSITVAPATGEPALRIRIARQGAGLVLSWDGTATLQSAAAVTGPWTDLSGATSPYSVTPSTSPMFYRLKQ